MTLFKLFFFILFKLFFFILLGVPFSLHAAIYKWEDKNHIIHYSSIPPDNKDATIIQPATIPAKGTEKEKERFEKIEAQFNEEKAKELANKQKERKEKEELKIKQTNCQHAKENLETLESKARIKMLANGTAILLTSEQKEEQIIKAKEMIKQYCSPN